MAARRIRTADEQRELDNNLFYAARTGSDQTVQKLLVEGASVDFTIDIALMTPLIAAAAGSGNLTTIKLLLESGADLWKTDLLGQTCMHWACINGRLDIIKHLMKTGLSLESPLDKKGKTPLDYLKEEHSCDIDLNQRRKECLRALKDGVNSSNETVQDTAATANTSEGLDMKPSLSVAINLLKDKSAMWDDIGRWLDVPLNKRKEWRRNTGLSDEARLEYVIDYWLNSKCHKPVTWAELICVLESNGLASSADIIKSHLGIESTA